MMNVRSALVTGANRGLGLEFIKQLAQRKPPLQHIFAGCRKPSDAKELQALAADNPSIKMVQLDVANADDIATATDTVRGMVESSGLDLLINNAGILLRHQSTSEGQDVSVEDLRRSLEVNTIGPIMLTQALTPFLKKAASTSKSFSMVVNITSRMGSIDDNTSGGVMEYRVSKCGINMATKTQALGLKGDNVVVICLHPGWVQTDIGSDRAPTTAEESVTQMFNVISSMKPADTGTFQHFRGSVLPW